MFQVFWKRRASGQLAEIWINASDRNRITAAVDSIDQTPRNDPDIEGESREGDERVLIMRPLVVQFRVSEEDRGVEARSVRQVREPRQG